MVCYDVLPITQEAVTLTGFDWMNWQCWHMRRASPYISEFQMLLQHEHRPPTADEQLRNKVSTISTHNEGL